LLSDNGGNYYGSLKLTLVTDMLTRHQSWCLEEGKLGKTELCVLRKAVCEKRDLVLENE